MCASVCLATDSRQFEDVVSEDVVVVENQPGEQRGEGQGGGQHG